jgi:hypothetical protein
MAQVERTDVFISHSSRDRDRIKMLAHALSNYDFSVWWDDREIPLGANWQEFLGEKLETAPCVIVVWSEASIHSEMVFAQADLAVRRSKFLPIAIDNVELPLRFNNYQVAWLADWTGFPDHTGFQRVVEAIRRMIAAAPSSSAGEIRGYKESARTAQQRAENLFQQNLRSQSIVEYIELDKTLFHERLRWNVTPGINVLLGRNGYGKTLLLRSVLALLQYDDDSALQTLRNGSATISVQRQGREELVQYSSQFFDEEGAIGKLPVLAIPDTRFIDRSVTTLSAVSDETAGRGDRTDLARYGAWHFLGERPYDSMIQGLLYGLCLDYFENEQSFRGEQFELVRDVVRELTDQSFEFERVAREGRDRFTLYVRTEGNQEDALPIQKCSQGTSSIIAMFGLIYDYLKSLRQDDAPKVTQRSGIVVIDEIDAHLHPLWQQKIVTLLRDRFPNVQFILTAHNPIVVAGCREDEVTVLRKNPAPARGFSLIQFPNDFIGWQTEDIYRKVFDIENPDGSFARLDAMRPFKGKMREEAEALAKRMTRSPDEERSLQRLEDDILYIEKVEQTRSQRLAQENLARSNKMLEDRLLGADAAHTSAAEAQRQLDAMRQALETQKQEAQRQLKRAVLVIAVLATIAAGALIFGMLTRLVPGPDSKAEKSWILKPN